MGWTTNVQPSEARRYTWFIHDTKYSHLRYKYQLVNSNQRTKYIHIHVRIILQIFEILHVKACAYHSAPRINASKGIGSLFLHQHAHIGAGTQSTGASFSLETKHVKGQIRFSASHKQHRTPWQENCPKRYWRSWFVHVLLVLTHDQGFRRENLKTKQRKVMNFKVLTLWLR
jgi:hypothetical protein